MRFLIVLVYLVLFCILVPILAALIYWIGILIAGAMAVVGVVFVVVSIGYALYQAFHPKNKPEP